MVPELRLLKKMAPAGVVIVLLAACATAMAGGWRLALSVAFGGIMAVTVLAMTAGGAVVFGRAGDKAVPISYAVGFFVKLGLMTLVMLGVSKVRWISLSALAVSMVGVYLSLLIIGALTSGLLSPSVTGAASEVDPR